MPIKVDYTLCFAYKTALCYAHKSDFQKNHSSLYKYAYRRGWTKLIFSHMTKKRKKPKWTIEEIMAEAEKYTVKVDFQRKSPSAYHAARVHGVLIDACKHMHRRFLPEEVVSGRTCNKCNEYKSIEEMCSNSALKSSVSSMCKSCHSVRTSEYGRENIAWKRAQTAKRRAKKRNATPIWLSKENLSEIDDLFSKCHLLSEQTGVHYEVDHIIPISNKHVCGLHVPWNLAIIPMQENRAKSNKFIKWWRP